MIVMAQTYLSSNRRPSIRQLMLRSSWWKLQFMCHPLLVAGLVYLLTSHPTIQVVSSILLVPVTFNFGVEPFVGTNDLPAQVLL